MAKQNKNSYIKSSKGILKRKVYYAQAVFGHEEKKAVLKSLDNFWLASGPLVKKFEEKIAKLFGKKYAVALNSGSSANLIALQSIHLPKGSEVITPACTFSTTASSILNASLIPVFIDAVIGRYTIDEGKIEKAIGPKTKAIMIPHLIGGVCDMRLIRKIANKYSLLVIEDSCDTLAPKIGKKNTASYSDITTTSFYGSHLITTMGSGGMLLTNSAQIAKRAIMLKDWGRVGDDNEVFNKRFKFSIDKIPFDSKFVYAELGYNFKMTEASAAFGLVQLKRLREFKKKREFAFNFLYSFFRKYQKWFFLPVLLPRSQTNWLAFPLTIRDEAPFRRFDFLKYMEKNGIQTRVLFSGNITRHPAYRKTKHRISGTLENSDKIMASSFLLGCHQGLGIKDLMFIMEASKKFLNKFS